MYAATSALSAEELIQIMRQAAAGTGGGPDNSSSDRRTTKRIAKTRANARRTVVSAMQSRSRRALTTAVMATVLAITAPALVRAQCPDGTPPPCRTSRPASRRSAPALSEHTWIVVPFTNVTRTPELEWLRDASVNLLTLELERWTDVGVIGDKRVADLLRTLPTARSVQQLSLGDGIAIARQAGAGRLVMGDFIKVGRGTRLVANIFEVPSGTRIRSVQQPVADPDSILSAFGPLARAVLAVPAPDGASVGALGTASADAYREYAQGLTALHHFELTEAHRHFVAAITRDSSFALAHYKLSIVMHWEGSPGSADERAHAATAWRLGATLPPRERALIRSRVASSTGDHELACSTLAALVKRDSADVEALYGLGDCRYHGGFLYPEATADTTRGRFRGDWNGAIAMFRRALIVDPSYHPAFEHILDMLTVNSISMCAEQGTSCANGLTTYTAWVIRDADSLLIEPVRGNFTVKVPMRARQDSTRSPLLNLREAQRIARDWTEAGPAESRAHLNLAKLDLLLGDLAGAKVEVGQIPANADAFARAGALETRVQLSILLGEGAAGRAALDTLAKLLPDDSTRALRLGALRAAFGQVAPLVSAMDAYGASHAWSTERRAYVKHRPYALLGMPLASMLADEQRYGESLAGDTLCAAGRPKCRITELFFTLVYASRTPRTWWPYTSTRPIGLRYFGSYAIWMKDTSYMSKMVTFLDSLRAAAHRAGNDEFSIPLYLSEVQLARGDSMGALRTARMFTDSTLTALARNSTSNDDWEWPYLIAPRMMKLRGDLAAKLGYAAEAKTWYERVLSLWANADAEFRPELNRMRAVVAGAARP